MAPARPPIDDNRKRAPDSRKRNASLDLLLAALRLAIATSAASAQVIDSGSPVKAVNIGSLGDGVRVGVGTFELSAPLVPRPGMKIQGAGRDKTIIRAADISS